MTMTKWSPRVRKAVDAYDRRHRWRRLIDVFGWKYRRVAKTEGVAVSYVHGQVKVARDEHRDELGLAPPPDPRQTTFLEPED